jgi:hypothetical protein
MDVGGGLFELGSAARANCDAGAFAREFFGDGATKPSASGGDDGYAALQPQIQFCTSFKLSMFSRNVHRVKFCGIVDDTGLQLIGQRYSVRSARIESIEAARRAGVTAVRAAEMASTAMATPRIRGS